MSATVDITIPVYNEEEVLPRTIATLTEFLETNLSNPWQVTIADNASTDSTQAVSEMLCRKHPGVFYLRIPQKGRGRALRTAWLDSQADIVSYMDADLSTDLSHFPQLIKALESGNHIAVGSRLSKDSQVSRGFKREFISRGYNLLINAMFFTGLPDAQCGFKALTRATAEAIVPNIKNNNWFFDTELLVIAAKRGFNIASVPVKWIDDPASTVNIASTAKEDIKGLMRLRFGGIPQVEPPAPLSL
ncbi:MAG: glycosyltransferase family 2 protein [Chloroflexi bacterium]|nr:glycosyltransferase family 2 protein [Chloroflexota bacterium]MCI0901273.1 glycosyltransferase family 2 protein [Chloroflexota bacterium]